MITEVNYYQDLTHESNSSLKLLRQDPTVYHAQRIAQTRQPKEPSWEMEFGTIFDDFIFNADAWGRKWVVDAKDDCLKKRKRKILEGKQLITSPECRLMIEMARSLNQNKSWCQAWKSRVGRPQTIHTWSDPDTGILCKCKTDLETEKCILDLKTIGDDASVDNCIKAIGDFEYYTQDAFYSDGVRLATGKVKNFCFVFVSREWPHRVRFVDIGEDMREIGRQVNRATLADLKLRRETGDWTDGTDQAAIEILTPQDVARYSYSFRSKGLTL